MTWVSEETELLNGALNVKYYNDFSNWTELILHNEMVTSLWVTRVDVFVCQIDKGGYW